MKFTKSQQAKEDLFSKEISPLIEQLMTVCKTHKLPLSVGVQLFIDKHKGARIRTESYFPTKTTIPLLLSESINRGSAKLSVVDSRNFKLALPDEDGQYTEEPQNLECFFQLSDNPHLPAFIFLKRPIIH